jgi:hypothetical protein
MKRDDGEMGMRNLDQRYCSCALATVSVSLLKRIQ